MSFLPPALCCQPPSLGPAWCLEPGTGETPSAGLWAFLWVEPGSSSQTHGEVPAGVPAGH